MAEADAREKECWDSFLAASTAQQHHEVLAAQKGAEKLLLAGCLEALRVTRFRRDKKNEDYASIEAFVRKMNEAAVGKPVVNKNTFKDLVASFKTIVCCFELFKGECDQTKWESGTGNNWNARYAPVELCEHVLSDDFPQQFLQTVAPYKNMKAMVGAARDHAAARRGDAAPPKKKTARKPAPKKKASEESETNEVSILTAARAASDKSEPARQTRRSARRAKAAPAPADSSAESSSEPGSPAKPRGPMPTKTSVEAELRRALKTSEEARAIERKAFEETIAALQGEIAETQRALKASELKLKREVLRFKGQNTAHKDIIERYTTENAALKQELNAAKAATKTARAPLADLNC